MSLASIYEFLYILIYFFVLGSINITDFLTVSLLMVPMLIVFLCLNTKIVIVMKNFIHIQFHDMLNEIDHGLLKYIPKEPPIFSQACKRAVTGGKHMRGIICICSCLAVGGVREIALPLAISFELAHAFSLVHDDIVDNDILRRGKTTIHTEFGTELAVVVGDYLHSASYRALHVLYDKKLISSAEYLRILGILYQFEKDICIGQALDMQSKIGDNPDECLNIAEKKTGNGFMAAAKLGAIAGGGGEEEEVIALSNYGKYLGISYQIRDDILDVAGKEDKIGKKIFSDARRARNTIVLSHLFSNINAEDGEFLFSLAGKKEFGNRETLRLKKLLKETGTIEFAQKMALVYALKAKEALKDLKDSRYKSVLVEMAEYAAKRDF